MAESEEYADVHMLFTRYSRHMSERSGLKLQEIFVYSTGSLSAGLMKTRFGNDAKGKVLCVRYNWYIKRIKHFSFAAPKKKLRIFHWDLVCSDPDTFLLNSFIYPDIAFACDSKSEHWFCARKVGSGQHIVIDSGFRDVEKESIIKSFLDKYMKVMRKEHLELPTSPAKKKSGKTWPKLHCVVEISEEQRCVSTIKTAGTGESNKESSSNPSAHLQTPEVCTIKFIEHESTPDKLMSVAFSKEAKETKPTPKMVTSPKSSFFTYFRNSPVMSKKSMKEQSAMFLLHEGRQIEGSRDLLTTSHEMSELKAEIKASPKSVTLPCLEKQTSLDSIPYYGSCSKVDILPAEGLEANDLKRSPSAQKFYTKFQKLKRKFFKPSMQ